MGRTGQKYWQYGSKFIYDFKWSSSDTEPILTKLRLLNKFLSISYSKFDNNLLNGWCRYELTDRQTDTPYTAFVVCFLKMTNLNSLGYSRCLISNYQVDSSSTTLSTGSLQVATALKLLQYSSVLLKHSYSEQDRHCLSQVATKRWRAIYCSWPTGVPAYRTVQTNACDRTSFARESLVDDGNKVCFFFVVFQKKWDIQFQLNGSIHKVQSWSPND